MSARKIPKSYRNVTGQISSHKSNKPISFESKLERDFYLIFDYELNVISIQDQPIRIEYVEERDGKANIRSYTPDVYIERTEGYPNIIGEVKYYNDLKEDWARLKPKFKQAIKYAKQQKEPTVFVIFTDRCKNISNKDYIRNIHFLDDYNDYATKDYESIKDLYSDGDTIGDILEYYSDDKMEQAQLVPSIWALVKQQIIEVDLTQWLTLKTKILSIKDPNDIELR